MTLDSSSGAHKESVWGIETIGLVDDLDAMCERRRKKKEIKVNF